MATDSAAATTSFPPPFADLKEEEEGNGWLE
jgi:hypothetical protein